MNTPLESRSERDKLHRQRADLLAQSLWLEFRDSRNGLRADEERDLFCDLVTSLLLYDEVSALRSAETTRTLSDFIRNASLEEKERVYTEVMDRASAAQSPEAPVTRWLIERGSPAEYLEDYQPGESSPGWTKDAHGALKMFSRQDAENLAKMLHPSLKARVCDHIFMLDGLDSTGGQK